MHTADCVETGLRLLREKNPDAIVMDIRMPGMTGIEGLRRIREIDPHLSVIMLTGFGALETAKEALRLGANDYISKPFDAREMREVIGRNVERTRIHRTSENAAARDQGIEQPPPQRTRAKGAACLVSARPPRNLSMTSAIRLRSSGVTCSCWRRNSSNPRKQRQRSGNGDRFGKELDIIEQNVRLCRELLTMWQSYGSVEAAPHKPISVSAIVREVVKGVGAMADAKRRAN